MFLCSVIFGPPYKAALAAGEGRAINTAACSAHAHARPGSRLWRTLGRSWQLFSRDSFSSVPRLTRIQTGVADDHSFGINWRFRLVDAIREVYLVWFIFLSLCDRLGNGKIAIYSNDWALNCTVTTNQCRDSLLAYLVHSLPIPSD